MPCCLSAGTDGVHGSVPAAVESRFLTHCETHCLAVCLQVLMECAGLSQPLFVLRGSCLGMEIVLDTDALPFGTVYQRSQTTRKLIMINSGDMNTRYRLFCVSECNMCFCVCCVLCVCCVYACVWVCVCPCMHTCVCVVCACMQSCQLLLSRSSMLLTSSHCYSATLT